MCPTNRAAPLRAYGHGVLSLLCLVAALDSRAFANGQQHGLLKWKCQAGEIVTSLAFSPRSDRLAVGFLSGRVQILNVRTGASVLELRGLRGFAFGLVFDNDGLYLASGGYQKAVVVWSMRTCKVERRFETKGNVCAVAFSPRARLVAAADDLGNAYVWKRSNGDSVGVWKGTGHEISKVSFLPTATMLICCYDHADAVVWDLTRACTGKYISRNCAFAAIEPERGIVAYAMKQWGLPIPREKAPPNVVERVDVHSKKSVGRIDIGVGMVEKMEISRDGRRLAAIVTRPLLTDVVLSLELWEIDTGRLIGKIPVGAGIPFALSSSPNGRYLAVSTGDNTIHVWDVVEWGAYSDGGLYATSVDKAWAALIEPGPSRAYRVLWTLAKNETQALKVSREHVHPARGASPAEVNLWLAQLDDPRFAVRQGAAKLLQSHWHSAEKALTARLRSPHASPEQIKRIKQLIGERERQQVVLGRVLYLLGLCSGPAARSMVVDLANGEKGDFLTAQAEALLSRTARPPKH